MIRTAQMVLNGPSVIDYLVGREEPDFRRI